MWTLLVWLLFGVAAGLFTRTLIPSRDGARAVAAVGLGIGGAVVGGLLGNMLWGETLLDLDWAALVGGGIGASSVLLASRSLRTKPA